MRVTTKHIRRIDMSREYCIKKRTKGKHLRYPDRQKLEWYIRENQHLSRKKRKSPRELWIEGPGYVFSNEFGEHISYWKLTKHFKNVLTSIGIEKRRFHDLRHTYAVSALRSGDDVKTVQANLGHHSAAFTLDIYGHVTDSMRQESAARMEAFIATLKKA